MALSRQAFSNPCWLFLCALLGVPPSHADTGEPASRHVWPGDFVGRVEALALLLTLDVDLLSHDSATLTLERWCATHRLAQSPAIVAERVMGVEKPPSEEQRRDLRVTPAEAVRYRRVRLRCGTSVLSEADNWYVPSRLTPAMNELLETTDTPFGRAVQALNFQRRTTSTQLLWLPLPAGWEMRRPAARGRTQSLIVPAHVLEHRAVLTLPDGTPFSEVVETYTGNVLGFPAPRP